MIRWGAGREARKAPDHPHDDNEVANGGDGLAAGKH